MERLPEAVYIDNIFLARNDKQEFVFFLKGEWPVHPAFILFYFIQMGKAQRLTERK